jgi:hypothetical protein
MWPLLTCPRVQGCPRFAVELGTWMPQVHTLNLGLGVSTPLSQTLRSLAFILQRNHPLRITRILNERKIPLRKTTRKQRNPFPKQYGNDSKMNFIHQVRFQKLKRQCSATHHPNVFPRPLSQAAHKTLRRLIHESHSVAFSRRRRTRKKRKRSSIRRKTRLSPRPMSSALSPLHRSWQKTAPSNNPWA